MENDNSLFINFLDLTSFDKREYMFINNLICFILTLYNKFANI